MKRQTLIASVLLFASAAAYATPQTTSGIASFAQFSGYGFSYAVTWDAPANYSVAVQSTSSGTGSFFLSAGGEVSLTPDAQGFDEAALDVQVTMTIRYINLATGQLGLPSRFYENWSYKDAGFSAASEASACTNPGATVALRFSNPTCSFNSAVVSGSGSEAAFPFPLEATSSATYSVRAGNFLVSSNDPSCASFACMTPGHDQINLRPFTLRASAIAAVPEPSAAAMLIAGMGAFMARRRKR